MLLECILITKVDIHILIFFAYLYFSYALIDLDTIIKAISIPKSAYDAEIKRLAASKVSENYMYM